MVQHVEEVHAQLHGDAFSKSGLLIEREVPLLEFRTTERVATHVAVVAIVVARGRKGTVSRNTACSFESRVDRSRNREGMEIEELKRIPLVDMHRPDHIRTVNSVAAAAVVIPESVIQVKGLTAL